MKKQLFQKHRGFNIYIGTIDVSKEEKAQEPAKKEAKNSKKKTSSK